jgi:hypothetical protein
MKSIPQSKLNEVQAPQPGAHLIDEPPPILGTWPRVYAAVLGYLFVLILVLYGLTVLFRY